MVVTELKYGMPVLYKDHVKGKPSKRNPEPKTAVKHKSGTVLGWTDTHVKIDPNDRATPYYVKLEDVI